MQDNLKLNMLTPAVGELVLNQPARRNALNAAMWEALPQKLAAALKLKGLKVLIIRGEGEHFAAGADISEFGSLYATPESAAKISAHIAEAMTALANFPLPTIAMVRGACVGGGCALALCCDIRFADETAKFAITPARLGLVYPYGDIQRLIEITGLANAKDLILSARLIETPEAHNMGLINFSHAPEALEAAVMDYANMQAALSPASLKIMKQMFSAYQSGVRGDNKQTKDWFHSGFTSRDFKEGYTAFMEKRKPRFK